MTMELSRDLPQIKQRIEQGWQLRVMYRAEWDLPFHARIEKPGHRMNAVGSSQRDALQKIEMWLYDIALGRRPG